jgi:hypothetical protein
MEAAKDGRSGGWVLPAAVILGIATACAPAGRASDGVDAPWAAPIRTADDALGRKEYSAALRLWHEAYRAALAAPGWEGLMAAGDAYLRIGEATGLRRSADLKTREIYLAALTRARQQGSVDGVLRAAEGLAALGDVKAVAQCVRLAEVLAARDPDARADVRAFKARLTSPALAGREATR